MAKLANGKDVFLIGLKGDRGEKGDPLTYADLTEEQKAEISSKSTLLKTVTGKNLLNPNTVETGAIQSDGSMSTVSSWRYYYTSEYIPIKPSTDYTLSAYIRGILSESRVLILLFDADKNAISSSYQNVVTGTVTVNSGNARFARCSTYTGSDLMLEEGASRSTLSEYFEYEAPVVGVDEIVVNKKENDLTLISKLGNDEIVQLVSLKGRQGLVNFEQTTINPATGITHRENDDVTPVRIDGLGTVGANHGYVVFQLTLSGQTTSDIGSLWTDGTREFILVKIVGDGTGLFASTYTETNGTVWYNNTLPTGELSHVSGAVNTATVSVSGATLAQLYPSVNNVSIKVFINEWEISGDSVETAKKVVIREDYTIVSYKSLIDYARNHIGSEIDVEALSGVLKVTNHYHFSAGGKCVVNTTLTAIEPLIFSHCGIIQSGAPSATNATLFRYINGVNAIGGVDFKSNADTTNITNNVIINDSDLTEADKPCNRSVDTLYLDGKKVLALSLGYFPTKTKAKDKNRKELSQLWELRSDSKKNYPVAFSGVSMNAGDCLSVAAYRCYLDLSYSVTNCNAVELGNVTYVFIDTHTAGTHKCKIGDKYVGRSINILSSEGITFNSDVVDSEGIVFTSEEYGAAVITLS